MTNIKPTHSEQYVSEIQYATFTIENRLFGLSLEDVREVNSDLSFTNIFHADPSVRGYMNIRGQIHLVIDMRVLLGAPASTTLENHRVVIFKPSLVETSGILVDKIGDVVKVSSDKIEERSGEQSKSLGLKTHADLIKCVCKLENELLVVLDSSAIIDAVCIANRAA